MKAHPPLRPLDLYMVQSTTERHRAYIEETERRTEECRTDARREARLAARECRWCYYRGPGLSGQMFTDWTCWSCGKEDQSSSTSHPRLCVECADKLGLCERCCADRELKSRKTLERK
jgi:hypothetical protein